MQGIEAEPPPSFRGRSARRAGSRHVLEEVSGRRATSEFHGKCGTPPSTSGCTGVKGQVRGAGLPGAVWSSNEYRPTRVVGCKQDQLPIIECYVDTPVGTNQQRLLKNVSGIKDVSDSRLPQVRSSRYIRYCYNIGYPRYGKRYNIGDNKYSSKNVLY